MTKFAYVAVDATGQQVEGTAKGKTIGEVRLKVGEKDLYPIKIEERRSKFDIELSKPKVKLKNLMNFTRQLSVFVRAGVPITDALTTIVDETIDVALRRALVEIIDDLRNGGQFSEAAANHPNVFPTYYVGILGAAEMTGKLDESLDSLAGYIARALDTKSKVQSALAYPAVVFSMAIVTVLVLAGYVLPKFKDLFAELGSDLPLSTRMMLGVSRLFGDLWWITAIWAAVNVLLLVFLTSTTRGKHLWQRILLKLPALGQIVHYSLLERFCSVLHTMLAAGVAVPDALATTTHSLTNVVYKEGLEEARNKMLEGGGFSQPLIDTGLFPGAARQMFRVGEQTGTLDEQLGVSAEYFESELNHKIKTFTTMFEPIMIIAVGVIVGFVAVALVQAMYGVLGGVQETGA